jgi:hypothetical protein
VLEDVFQTPDPLCAPLAKPLAGYNKPMCLHQYELLQQYSHRLHIYKLDLTESCLYKNIKNYLYPVYSIQIPKQILSGLYAVLKALFVLELSLCNE